MLGKIHFNRLKLLTQTAFDVKWLDDYGPVAIFLDFLEMLQVNGQILIKLVHVSLLLVDHGAHQVQMLHVLRVVRVLQAFRQFFVDNGESLVPVLVLNVINYHIVAEFANIQGAEADVGEVRALTAVTVHRVDGRHELTRREPTVHFLSIFAVDAQFLGRVFATLAILGHLLLGQNVVVPRPSNIPERLIIFAQIHLENTAIEVHVFQLEDVLPVVARPIHRCQRL